MVTVRVSADPIFGGVLWMVCLGRLMDLEGFFGCWVVWDVCVGVGEGSYGWYILGESCGQWILEC